MKLIPQSYQTPNAYIDLFLPYLESDEWRVLSYAIRHIFGWEDKIDSRRRRISISTFENGVPGFPGCGLSRPAIVNALGGLTQYGLIKKIGEPTSKGQLYELPVDSNEVNLSGLKKRLDDKKAESTKRTAKARKIKKQQKETVAVSATNQPSPVNGTNQSAVSTTNQWRLVRLTSGGKSHLLTQTKPLKPACENQRGKPAVNGNPSRDSLSSVLPESGQGDQPADDSAQNDSPPGTPPPPPGGISLERAQQIINAPTHYQRSELRAMSSHPIIDGYSEVIGAPYLASEGDMLSALKAQVLGYTFEDAKNLTLSKTSGGKKDYPYSYMLRDLAAFKGQGEPVSTAVKNSTNPPTDPNWRPIHLRNNPQSEDDTPRPKPPALTPPKPGERPLPAPKGFVPEKLTVQERLDRMRNGDYD